MPEIASDTIDRANKVLVVTRLLRAPRALAFAAWTDPAQVAQWWGPQGYTTIFCDMDIRVGGAYRFGMRSPEGTEHWKRGVYREISPPQRIVFTFTWEAQDGSLGPELLTTVSFAEEDGGTRLTLRQEQFATLADCDGHRIGWTSCLARFAAWLEQA